MNYNNLTREQLIAHIEELELLNRQLLIQKEQETKLEYAWTHNLSQWFYNVKTNTVTFNPLKAIALGYDKDEIPQNVPYQYFTDKVHPDDYEKTMKAMLDHMQGKVNVYEVDYRIKGKDGKYRCYYVLGKITEYDEENRPLFVVGIVFDITEKREMEEELKKQNKKLNKLATTDELTKVCNRRKIMNQLQIEIQNPDRRNNPLSIAMLDLDNFKKINDTKGHVVDDSILVDTASIIKKTIRESDFVGRYGGEEFLIIFTNTDLDNAVKVTERIRIAIENHTFINDLIVTISGGVEQYKGEDMIELIQIADRKLYEAKNTGKNLIVY